LQSCGHDRAATDALPLLPFFLPASGGQRYCLLHLPPPGRPRAAASSTCTHWRKN
jgi:hypothetical protein